MSPVAEAVEAYVAFRARTGAVGTAMSWHLRDLARWCEENGHRELTREAAEGYVAQRLARTDPGQSTWVSYVRELGRWMRANGHPDAHVLGPRWSGRSERRLPYLLKSSEVDAFFSEAARYSPRSPMRWQARCLFGLMCSCGLRTCEARRLGRGDVDAAAGTLSIARSKGHRSRTIAVTDEVIGMLAESDRLTTEAVGESREALFSTGGGRMLAPSDVTVAFRRIWEAAGLPAERGGRRATPYAFRHRFAYANVERWGREGLDAMAMLPYLQRYMGHASPESTLYYVHTSPDFLSGFAGEMSRLDALLPEVTDE